ncbi:MAG TPA: response regulator [Bacteriovoracaceae bacterium]|nr:response regulator [Bacteriovoracaceae bacterium]
MDDESTTTEAFSEILQSFGAITDIAHSVREALDQIKLKVPHILVSDIAMPEADGYTLIKKLRALPANKGGKIPAIAVTAYAGNDDVQKALDSGFQAYLAKPLEAIFLAETIADLISGPKII